MKKFFFAVAVRRVAWVVAIMSLALGACSTRQSGRAPKNIIVMIGDGMGISHITAGETAKKHLELEKFHTVGLSLTHAYGKDYITDSAAGATALSTGVKTFNGAIAVGPDSLARETLLERAAGHRKKTGVVVACSITEATPACFVAHVPSRRDQLTIAEQISKSSVDLFLGGGWGWFLPADQGGRRKDGKNLVEVMRGNGFAYVTTPDDFRSGDWSSTSRLLGLFSEDSPEWAQTRSPSLPELVAASLEFLSRSTEGFVLVVEGSQIDWAAHAGNSDQVVAEMVDFDNAIGEALKFSRKNGETLVIVTADHETGGYALTGGSRSDGTVEGKFVTGGHTAAMVPVFADGPGAGDFSGIHENSEIGERLHHLLD